MEDYLFEGNISVKAAVMGGMREVMEIIADENKRDKDTRWILHRAAERGIPIRRTSREEIDAAASGHTHGGLLARCGARRFQPLDDLAEKGRFLALIEGIEDPFNFGMILRTLYASGCDGVVLPPRNWTSAAAIVARASAGASEHLSMTIAEDMETTIAALKDQGIALICADRKDARCLYDYSFPDRLCLAIGGGDARAEPCRPFCQRSECVHPLWPRSAQRAQRRQRKRCICFRDPAAAKILKAGNLRLLFSLNTSRSLPSRKCPYIFQAAGAQWPPKHPYEEAGSCRHEHKR